MKRRFFSLLLVVLTSTIAFAGPVDLEQAKGKAARFMKELNGSRISADAGAEYAPARSVKGKRTKTDVPAYYVFNVQDEKGFVIVSGDDNTDEILGYSTNGSFDMESMPENVKAWLEGYAEQIAMLETYAPQHRASMQNSTQWSAISPLTRTQWNQNAPYNDKCPKHGGERSVTGCTATAMAQIMKFHEWPQAETSPIPGYTTETAKIVLKSLSATTFNWEDMHDSYGMETKADAVAELMQYCGQAILSDYTKDATGAFTADVAIALQRYFDYDANLELKRLNYYSPSEWETIIYEELQNGRPVYHAGYSMGGGHAFVCDGYDGNGMYHFNWGWGGSYDGYYKLSLMNPGVGGIGSGSADGYSWGQEIITGIQPPTGEKAKPKYLLPDAEQIVNKSIFSYFLNPHMSTLTADAGFAVIDEDDNIVRRLKVIPLTVGGNYSDYEKYVGLDLENEATSLTPGKHRIATVCRPRGSVIWKRVGSSHKYFEVTKDESGRISDITLHPQQKVRIKEMKCSGNLVAGGKQNVTISLENMGDELNTAFYLFASTDDEPGEAESRTAVLMKQEEHAELSLHFTPEAEGTYNIWLSDDINGHTQLMHIRDSVKPAPKRASNLSLISCVPDKNRVSAKIRIRNNSSEGYYRGIVAILLEDLYGDGSLYGTEVMELPGDIEPGSIKTFDFQFKDAESYSECAIYIGYYKKHTDASYTQLGDFVFFTTGDTPVHDIDAASAVQEPAYRPDGVRMTDLKHKGIVIRKGKIQLQK